MLHFVGYPKIILINLRVGSHHINYFNDFDHPKITETNYILCSGL